MKMYSNRHYFTRTITTPPQLISYLDLINFDRRQQNVKFNIHVVLKIRSRKYKNSLINNNQTFFTESHQEFQERMVSTGSILFLNDATNSEQSKAKNKFKSSFNVRKYLLLSNLKFFKSIKLFIQYLSNLGLVVMTIFYFLDLLEAGWEGEKKDLEVLHL